MFGRKPLDSSNQAWVTIENKCDFCKKMRPAMRAGESIAGWKFISIGGQRERHVCPDCVGKITHPDRYVHDITWTASGKELR